MWQLLKMTPLHPQLSNVGSNNFLYVHFPFSGRIHPKLKSRHKERVRVALDYMRTIENFNNLIDPQTLFRHFLGPEPSPFVLRAVQKEEKSIYFMLVCCLSICLMLTLIFDVVSEMTTKFNQEMYAWMKAKQNEPLSSISQKRPRASVKEVVETTLSVLALLETRVASLAFSLEEITPCLKRTRNGDNGKSKVDASVWDNVSTALGKAHNIITADELKGLSAVPFHELVNRHIHKLIQVFFVYICFFSQVMYINTYNSLPFFF